MCPFSQWFQRRKHRRHRDFMYNNEPLDYMLSYVCVEACRKLWGFNKAQGFGRAGLVFVCVTLWYFGRCNTALTSGLFLQSRDSNPAEGGCAAQPTQKQKLLRDHWKQKTASTQPVTSPRLLNTQMKKVLYAYEGLLLCTCSSGLRCTCTKGQVPRGAIQHVLSVKLAQLAILRFHHAVSCIWGFNELLSLSNLE